MIFSSYKFLLGFFPVTTILYWVFNALNWTELAKIELIVASFFFYSQGSPKFFPFFLGSVLANYVAGITLIRLQEDRWKVQRKVILAITVIANVALLGYYKYLNFFIENVNALTGLDLPMKQLVLPIGISFFTFQLIAFVVDCYKGKTKKYDITEYLLFITFFPQLIVGPIVHHAEITPQFEDHENMKFNWNNVALGIFIFAIGCGKKMILADPMNTSAAAFYGSLDGTQTMWECWYYTLQYSISYYFDLSGYTDMAIGLALFYNIHLPENFNSPFKSRNMQEYWQRQHMTLSRFLGGYVFKSVFVKGSKWRNYYVATMVTFLVSGIWHGAGWSFIIWGLMNGVLVCWGAWEKYNKKYPPLAVGMILTFFAIVLTRVIFVAPSLSATWQVYRTMFDFGALAKAGWSTAGAAFIHFIKWHKREELMILISLFICYCMPNARAMREKFKPDWKHFLFTAAILGYCLMRMNKVVSFLYFQF